MTLTPPGYRPRTVDGQIEALLRSYGAVCIEGTKFCGKTWTSMNHASSVYALDDPRSDYRNYRLASADLDYALSGEAPRLVDEWQMIPGIWDGVRRSVDAAGGKGMYILSGSSVPEDPAGGIVPHSGIGRIATVRMRTMSLFESGDSDGSVSLRGLFGGGFKGTPVRENRIEDLARLTVRGGWPANVSPAEDGSTIVMHRYVEELCERDVPRVDRSKNPSRMKRLIRSLARNEATLASASRLSRDMLENEDDEMKSSTVSDYLDVLDRMFLIENQPAFSPNARSSVKVGKAPKRHLADPAIAASALGLDEKGLLEDLETFGFLFEALCERDLQVYAQAMGGSLMHYRDDKGREVDAVVELPDGRWGAFEIKLGTGRIDQAAEGLLRVSDAMEDVLRSRRPEFMCVLSGTEGAAYRREDGVYVVPITSLRDRGPRAGGRPRFES